jgi:single-strand DNA-binding protein
MYESYVTIVGNLTADPILRHTKDGRPFATFRVASTPRRWDGRSGGFVDGGTNFVSVAAFNALAANVVASCTKGQPVLVYGRLRINSWTTPEGRTASSVEIDAYHVGHDLSWGQAAFTKHPARVQFDSRDRLADSQIQESLAQLERPDGVSADAGGRPDAGAPGDFEVPCDEDLEGDLVDERPELEGSAAQTVEQIVGLGDPRTDPYVVARAG